MAALVLWNVHRDIVDLNLGKVAATVSSGTRLDDINALVLRLNYPALGCDF